MPFGWKCQFQMHIYVSAFTFFIWSAYLLSIYFSECFADCCRYTALLFADPFYRKFFPALISLLHIYNISLIF